MVTAALPGTLSSPSSSTSRIRASSGSRDGESWISATATGGVGRGDQPSSLVR